MYSGIMSLMRCLMSVSGELPAHESFVCGRRYRCNRRCDIVTLSCQRWYSTINSKPVCVARWPWME